MNVTRLSLFAIELEKRIHSDPNVKRIPTARAARQDMELFHEPKYVEFVLEASKAGAGLLDEGDTPAFPGIYDASAWIVGTTLNCLKYIEDGREVKHAINPVGGLHHAKPGRAGGFCVFNDASIAIMAAHKHTPDRNILYFDIDAHHGDGVYYPFEEAPWLYIVDIHEDGRYLYPGTGYREETGTGRAIGTKINLCLRPGAGDDEFMSALEEAEEVFEKSNPWLIIFQAGADGLLGDPLTHLRYSAKSHGEAARRIHRAAHRYSDGRLLVLGGGGYSPENVANAWLRVTEELLQGV